MGGIGEKFILDFIQLNKLVFHLINRLIVFNKTVGDEQNQNEIKHHDVEVAWPQAALRKERKQHHV
ncbi:hypothetical protein D3C74_252830 [compost metagenome]